MTEFVDQLFQEGRVILVAQEVPGARDLRKAVARICRYEEISRKSLAGVPPVVDLPAVGWGLEVVYRCSQLLAFPNLDANREPLPRVPVPFPLTPSTVYSVDLTFRFLPDLFRLARSSKQELLAAKVLQLAQDWPLSSVGMAGIANCNADDFLEDRTLRMLYVDRIIAAQDVFRLQDDRVRDAVGAALGGHSSLALQLVPSLNLPE